MGSYTCYPDTLPAIEGGGTVIGIQSEVQKIAARNATLDLQEREAKSNPWRFLCWVMPHRWRLTHLFDDPPDEFNRWHGVGNYAGICSRCGKRDLFRKGS